MKAHQRGRWRGGSGGLPGCRRVFAHGPVKRLRGGIIYDQPPPLRFFWFVFRAGRFRVPFLRSRLVLLSPRRAPKLVLLFLGPPQLGWYPGDPHLHPEGQYYGMVSFLGLTPETMLRQVAGEALYIGGILIWSGGYYYEKQFLTGHAYSPSHRQSFPDQQAVNNSSLSFREAPRDRETIVPSRPDVVPHASTQPLALSRIDPLPLSKIDPVWCSDLVHRLVVRREQPGTLVPTARTTRHLR